MNESIINPLTITFTLYTIGMILIGYLAYRATKNFSDYILGGRGLGYFVTALSAGASDMSGWLLMGLPGAIYASGLSQSWIAIGLTIGAWFNWYFLAGRLRVHTEHNRDALTLPDYFTQRFEDKSRVLRIVSAAVILVFFTIYCASGTVAGARLFEATFGLPYVFSIFLGATATIIYVFIGGFLAVSWTDTVQASLMIFALLLLPIVCILSMGDFNYSLTVIDSVRANGFNMLHGTTFIGLISLMGWGLGYFGQPHILSRFMAADSVKSMAKARRVSMAWMILCLVGAIAAGFFGIAYFAENPGQMADYVNGNNERVFLELTKLLFNPWVAGIVLSGVLAAVMSTLSCQLLICSSTLTGDFYKVFVRPSASQTELVWVSRFMVLLVAVIAIIIALDPDSKVLSLVSYAWAGFGAAFGPVVLLSVLWKRMTRNGALAGMVVGAATVVLWKNFLSGTELYEIIPGFIFATVAIVVASLVDAEPSAEIVERFDRAEEEFRAAQ